MRGYSTLAKFNNYPGPMLSYPFNTESRVLGSAGRVLLLFDFMSSKDSSQGDVINKPAKHHSGSSFGHTRIKKRKGEIDGVWIDRHPRFEKMAFEKVIVASPIFRLGCISDGVHMWKNDTTWFEFLLVSGRVCQLSSLNVYRLNSMNHTT